jgi:hypothetical protein
MAANGMLSQLITMSQKAVLSILLCRFLSVIFILANDQPERRERVSRTLKVLVGISILWF